MKIRTKILWFVGALALAGAPACEDGPKGPGAAHLKAGDEALAGGDFAKAAEEYGKSLEADPKQEKVWEKKAYSYKQAGDMAKAEEAILKTLDFKPDAAAKAQVYANLAGVYMEKNDTANAEKNYAEAIKLNPNDDQSIAWMAEFAARRGGARDMKAPIVAAELKKAIESYDKVIALKPSDTAAYTNKRIAVGRLMEHERLQKEAATKEGEEAVAAKDKAKEDDAKARADKHQAQMDEYKKQLDELGKKIGELMKAAKK
ncbi:tetratricopeptide repeat protein [Polyangium jinanense]|uniref:Tetratricopeptide repeat protein n=1 Tax=Polyangium jinanense TaxID=2829994 RepID=A0A9X3XC94_9BACT|nr:tetratricopeptide repeat protein [Polyangium jinanense]MDC3957178.1 tetratricopeptide repeat protein [Polyangium jinanense]MDC3986665.1 tetratricopeptide repeat protein [Polyangium jinanense]